MTIPSRFLEISIIAVQIVIFSTLYFLEPRLEDFASNPDAFIIVLAAAYPTAFAVMQLSEIFIDICGSLIVKGKITLLNRSNFVKKKYGQLSNIIAEYWKQKTNEDDVELFTVTRRVLNSSVTIMFFCQLYWFVIIRANSTLYTGLVWRILIICAMGLVVITKKINQLHK